MSHARGESSKGVPSGGTTVNPRLHQARRPRPDVTELFEGIRARDRVLLAQAISRVESLLPDDRQYALDLLNRCQSVASDSVRVAISGPPGAGKSTLIDSLGYYLAESGLSVAVLAVDPTSARSGGSILGDKTRMPRLSVHERAFVRPTPNAGVLGGVARFTRPAISLCEAAGFDVILVETVGVGQSETTVRDMVDFFLLLALSGAGDELQGIKRGIVEVADAIVVTKADGDNAGQAAAAASRLQSVLHVLPPHPAGWSPRATTCSAVEETGIVDLWGLVQEYRAAVGDYWEAHRSRQMVHWFEEEVQTRRNERVGRHATDAYATLAAQVSSGRMHPFAAAEAYVQTEAADWREG